MVFICKIIFYKLFSTYFFFGAGFAAGFAAGFFAGAMVHTSLFIIVYP